MENSLENNSSLLRDNSNIINNINNNFNESQLLSINNNYENNSLNNSNFNRTNRTFPFNEINSEDNLPSEQNYNETFVLDNLSTFNLDLSNIDENIDEDIFLLNNNLSNLNNNNLEDLNEENENSSSKHLETSTVNSAEIDDIFNVNQRDNKRFNKRYLKKKKSLKHIKNLNNNINNISNCSNSSTLIYSKSSPLIVFNKLEFFKTTSQFKFLESCYFFINKLNMIKNRGKFDLESEEGNNICKELLKQIENLIINYKIKISNREYRKKFTKAYIFLYDKNSLGYLTEILDSAQESTPYLIVNGEKYIFSKEAIEKGNHLFISFCNLIYIITEVMDKISDEYDNEIYIDINIINKFNKDIKNALIDFDKKWTIYEEKYITELIYIEKYSRRFIFEGIKIEKELTLYENKMKTKFKSYLSLINDTEYNKKREKFIKNLNILNKIANINGKGRDDLDINILYNSEKVLTTVSEVQSSGLRKLAKNINKSINDFRILFKKYNNNIEIVDPQLINNVELVNNLSNFETMFEKGKKYFCDSIKFKQLLEFNQMIQIIIEKYKKYDIFKLIEDSDPSIFVSIPSVLILKCIDSKNYSILNEYIENIQKNEIFIFCKNVIRNVYKQMKDSYKAYNLFEKLILFENSNNLIEEENIIEILSKNLDKKIGTIQDFLKDIKILSMNLQRDNPSEWNEFFELAMDI